MAAPALSTPFQPYVYQSPQASVIPFQILGGESQVLQIMLKAQEKILARPGCMCYMSGSIKMENLAPPENVGGAGLLQWLFGRTVISVLFTNTGPQDGYVGLAAPSVSRILPIDLAMFGGEMICQPDAFLGSINDVSATPIIMRRLRVGFLGAEGFLMHKLVGQGLAFLTVGGSMIQKSLAAGEVVVVDANCVVALTKSIDMQVRHTGHPRRSIFGADGVYTAHLTGPGVVFIQSLPFHRLAQRIARSVTPAAVRDHPRFFAQVAIFLFIAYIMVLSSLILVDV